MYLFIRFLQIVNLGQDLIHRCVRFDQVIIQLVDDEDCTREAHFIEQELRVIRRGITFRVEKRLV